MWQQMLKAIPRFPFEMANGNLRRFLTLKFNRNTQQKHRIIQMKKGNVCGSLRRMLMTRALKTNQSRVFRTALRQITKQSKTKPNKKNRDMTFDKEGCLASLFEQLCEGDSPNLTLEPL